LKALNETRDRIAALSPKKINAIVSKLDKKPLAILSDEQLKALDIEKIPSDLIKKWFDWADKIEFQAKRKDYTKNIVTQLGVAKVNKIIEQLPLSCVPDDFFANDSFELERLDEGKLNMFFNYYEGMDASIVQATNRMKRLSATKLALLQPKFNGKSNELLQKMKSGK